jgi:hypothetical protein
LHGTPEDPGEAIKEPAEERGAFAISTLENDVGGELLKVLEPAPEHMGTSSK